MTKWKVLNLYSGIGGNRKLWKDVEVTAVEINPEIAKIYSDFFPEDTVIVDDAHKYLLDHFKDGWDFIWSSPLCVSHSKINTLLHARGINRYPDMSLWQEIIFLNQFFDKKWVVENVVPYYDCFIKPSAVLGRHLFWSDFPIKVMKIDRRFNYVNTQYNDKKLTKDNYGELEKYHGFDLSEYEINNKLKLLRNCVYPGLGLHIFKCANYNKQIKLDIIQT